jgi:hypothetical protein
MATVEELKEYYANLLILQYLNKPKAMATIKAVVEPVIMDQLPVDVQDAFAIGTAEGVQLDVIGKYVGVSRSGYGTSGQPITLNDDDYTTLIKMVIIKNNSGSSLATIQELLAANFPGQIFISDSTTMSLNYLIRESLGTSDLLELLATGGYLPKPMAVSISIVIVPDIEFPFFGFYDSFNPSVELSGFNFYEFYNPNSPWLGAT